MRKLLPILVVVSAVAGPPAQAREVVFGLRPIPPLVTMETPDRPSGLEYEILAAALAAKGHTLKPFLSSLSRMVAMYRAGQLEAAAPVLASFNLEGTLSTPYLTYHNIVLTTGSGTTHISNVEDLSSHRVLAFQSATNALGPEFASAVARSLEYREGPNQALQVQTLLVGRTDAVVGERRILRHFLRSAKAGGDTGQMVREHAILAPLPYSAIFRDPALANDFNEGLQTIISNGTYAAILGKYDLE